MSEVRVRVRLRVMLFVVVCVATAVAVAGCGGSKKTTSSSSAATTPATTAAGTTTSTTSSSPVALALAFTGGKMGKATLAPIKVGFVNALGGLAGFPEMTAASQAAVAFINESLDGIAGHVVQLDECSLNAEEEGPKCAAQMVNDKVPVALLGVLTVANTAFWNTLKQSVPTLQMIASSPADYSTAGTYSYIGGNRGILGALASDVAKHGIKNVAVLTVENPSGKAAAPEMSELLAENGVSDKGKTAFYPETVTVPNMESTLEAAKASSLKL